MVGEPAQATAEPAPVTADALLSRLRLRCAAPAWALFPEFRGSTGHDQRALDALAVSLFPSQGLEVHGFEIKVSRGDLLRELKDPAKSEAVARFCDRFWLVLPAARIAEGLEVPDPWGLLVPSGKDGLRAAKKAAKLPGMGEAVLDFAASLARRAHREDAVPKAEHVAAVEAARKKAVEEDRR